MEKTISNINIVITGANRGLGYALIEHCLKTKNNITIIMTARNEEKGLKSFETIKKLEFSSSNKLLFHQLDVTDIESRKSFKEYLIKNNIKIDILVNNAGVAHVDDWVHKIIVSYEIAFEIINCNFFSLVSLSEELLPLLSEKGKIINVTSEDASLCFHSKEKQNLLNKKISKDELTELANTYLEKRKENKSLEGWSQQAYQFSKGLANAYGRWVLVDLIKENQFTICVDPGWVNTDMGGNNAPLTIIDSNRNLSFAMFDIGKEFCGKFLIDSKIVPFDVKI